MELLTNLHYVDPRDLEGRVSWSEVHNDGYCGNAATMAIIPYTSWGDYVGGSCERSNYRSILMEFGDDTDAGSPDWLIEIGNQHDGCALGVVLEEWNNTPEDEREELAEIIQSMEDYPVHDEDDLSQLELDIMCEDWESFGRYDLCSELDKFDALEEIEELYGLDTFHDIDADVLWTWFDGVCEEVGMYWECETAVSGFWRMERVTNHLTDADLLRFARLQFDADYRTRVALETRTALLFA